MIGGKKKANSTVIVVPCYNEAQRLNREAFHDFISAARAHLCFVDDGSRDETYQLLAELRKVNSAYVTLMRLETNQGKAEAVRQGILRAVTLSPRYIGFWDADLAAPLRLIGQFIEHLDTHAQLEMIIGSRVKLMGKTIHRRARRHYIGRVVATLASMILRLPVYDTQCGAKLFRNGDKVKHVFSTPFLSRWVFDIEIIARMIEAHAGSPPEQWMYELPLEEWKDMGGSKLRTSVVLQVGLDLWRIYWRFGRTRSISRSMILKKQ